MKQTKLLIVYFVLTGCSAAKINQAYKPIFKSSEYENFQIEKRSEGSIPIFVEKPSSSNLVTEEETEEYINKGYVILGISNLITDKRFDSDDYKSFTTSSNYRDDTEFIDTVIFTSKYLGSQTSSISYSTPTSSTTYHSGSVYGTGGSANYYGSSTTYGSKINTVPITVHSFKNTALFLSKSNVCSYLRSGLGYHQASKEIQKHIGERESFVVNRVCKESPAYKAGLFIGDIFILDKTRTPAANEEEIHLKIFRSNKVFNITLPYKNLTKSNEVK